jgi:hypothetical protein
MDFWNLFEFLELKSIRKRISLVHSNRPHWAHNPLANTGLAGLLATVRCVRSRRGHRARRRFGWHGLAGSLGVPFSAVGARVAYGEGTGQGGGGRPAPGRRDTGEGRHSPGWRDTGEGRWRLWRRCAAAFPVGERWPTVGIEVLHHQEEGMKGEAPRMRAESDRRW